MDLPNVLVQKQFIEQHIVCSVSPRAAQLNYPRILCSIPVYHSVDPRPFMRFLLFAQESGIAEAQGKWAIRWNVAGPKTRIRPIRETAAAIAQHGKATHLLFIDDDMMVETNMVPRLLAHDVDIVGPLFFGAEKKPLAFDLDEKREPVPIWDHPKDRLFECPGGIGTGVMLIKREVIDKMEPPLFLRPAADHAIGEDLEFCMKAATYGFKTWCDPTIIIDQLGIPEPIPRGD